MSRGALPFAEILDEAAAVSSRIAAPFLGVVWLTALPARMLQVHFVARVIDLGPQVAEYGHHLDALALLATAALVVSVYGRAVFVRACGLSLRATRAPGIEAFRVPAAGLLSYLYTALLLQAAFYALGWTLVVVPLLLTLDALAAATFALNEVPGLLGPLHALARHSGRLAVLLGLSLVFGVALLIAYANIFILFQLGAWLAQGLPEADLAAWQPILGFLNPRFQLVLVAGASLAVEPFWLAAHAVYVHKLGARTTGEDLRSWLGRLQREAA